MSPVASTECVSEELSRHVLPNHAGNGVLPTGRSTVRRGFAATMLDVEYIRTVASWCSIVEVTNSGVVRRAFQLQAAHDEMSRFGNHFFLDLIRRAPQWEVLDHGGQRVLEESRSTRRRTPRCAQRS